MFLLWLPPYYKLPALPASLRQGLLLIQLLVYILQPAMFFSRHQGDRQSMILVPSNRGEEYQFLFSPAAGK